MFVIKDVQVTVDSLPILAGVSLTCVPGSTHAIMGPNGGGKSTLAYTIMGHPRYVVNHGMITYNTIPVHELAPDARARLGIFLAMQHPIAIPGVTVASFIKEAMQSVSNGSLSVPEFQKQLFAAMDFLHIDQAFAQRNLNEDFSGGEKKKLELLQMLLLKPKLVILDEIDSGLDVDALVLVAKAVEHARTHTPEMVCIVITHYPRLLQHLVPDHVHVLSQGTIIRSGDASLAHLIEARGYDGISS